MNQKVFCYITSLFSSIVYQRFFCIPEIYDIGYNKDSTELCVTLENHRKTVVVSSKKGVETLGNSNDWFGDGTFFVCQDCFSQVYVIMEGRKTTTWKEKIAL